MRARAAPVGDHADTGSLGHKPGPRPTIDNASVARLYRSGVDLSALTTGGNAAVCRAVEGAGSSGAPEGFTERLAATGAGQPIPAVPKERLEAGFGVPLNDVRLHTGSASAALARQVDARAFTVGSDVHFGQGQFDAGSPPGFRLLAHEVTHTLQQSGNPAGDRLEVSAPDSPAEQAADRAADAVAGGGRIAGSPTGTPPVIGRDPTPAAPAAPATVTGLDPALAASLSDEDKHALAQTFTQGIHAAPPQTMIVGMTFGTRLTGYRVPVIRLTPVAEVGRGVEAYIMQIGKGRSILLSSIGGGSVLLDAGSGTTTSVNAQSVQRLVSAIGAVTANGVATPQLIKLSHADTDHYNAARELLRQSAFSRTAVEVATQQLGAASGGAWTASSLTVDTDQRLITVDITGGSVMVRKSVIDNMELTEFRSVAAAQALAEPDRTTFNRNATSPVVVVRDLVSGERMVFTGDAEGHQFTEIVNAVGDAAMRRILGAEGLNLRVMEDPHHFGKQAGPDATGMLNMLKLAFESGEGDLRVFAQTTRQFATNETRQQRSFRFLDAIGVAPERVEGDPSPAGQSQVTRARGSTMERVTLDFTGVQRAMETLQANETALRAGYRKLAELKGLRADAGAMREALSAGAPAPLTSSLAATDAELTRVQTALQTAVDAVWTQARTAADAAEGLKGSADFSGVTAALNQVNATVNAEQENLTKAANDMEAHQAGLSLYSRLYVNALRMVAALQADDVTELHARRAEHTDLVRAAAGTLGPDLVHDHVRAAWAATRAEWTPARIEEATRETSQRLVSRQMSAEFRARLAESLIRQGQLNELAARAEHGGRTVYGAGGTIVTPVSTRVGAGILAMIEIVRIGLDIAVQLKDANQRAEENQAANRRDGVRTMLWWQQHGVKPTIALAQKGTLYGWNLVFTGDQAQAAQAATSDTRPPGVPEFDMVVVTSIDPDGLRAMVHHLIAELAGLGDWYTFVNSYPPGQALRKIGADWAVLLWDSEEEEYRYFVLEGLAPGVPAELDRLSTDLEAGQQARMDAAAGAPGAPAASTVKDSALVFGQERRVQVYDQHGHPHVIDFDEVQPKFLRQATVAYPFRAEGPLVRVKAADMITYRRLADWFWPEQTGQQSWDASGLIHDEWISRTNSEGFAYVRENQLVPTSR